MAELNSGKEHLMTPVAKKVRKPTGKPKGCEDNDLVHDSNKPPAQTVPGRAQADESCTTEPTARGRADDARLPPECWYG